MQDVKGADRSERAAIRTQNARERRMKFFRDQIDKHPEGSFARLRQALDFVRAVAANLSPQEVEQISVALVRLALERNEPRDDE